MSNEGELSEDSEARVTSLKTWGDVNGHRLPSHGSEGEEGMLARFLGRTWTCLQEGKLGATHLQLAMVLSRNFAGSFLHALAMVSL